MKFDHEPRDLSDETQIALEENEGLLGIVQPIPDRGVLDSKAPEFSFGQGGDSISQGEGSSSSQTVFDTVSQYNADESSELEIARAASEGYPHSDY